MSQIPGRLPEAAAEPITTETEKRKPYIRPEIIHELELETRAGSPLGLPDPLDPFGLNPKK